MVVVAVPPARATPLHPKLFVRKEKKAVGEDVDSDSTLKRPGRR